MNAARVKSARRAVKQASLGRLCFEFGPASLSFLSDVLKSENTQGASRLAITREDYEC